MRIWSIEVGQPSTPDSQLAFSFTYKIFAFSMSAAVGAVVWSTLMASSFWSSDPPQPYDHMGFRR